MFKRVIMITSLIFTFAISSVKAQEISTKNVPNEVKIAFQKMYPNVYVYKWELKQKSNVYEANFMDKATKYEAQFLKSGSWLMTLSEIEEEALPIVVINYLKSGDYKNWKIDDCENLSKPGYKKLYSIELKYQKQKHKVILTHEAVEIERIIIK